MVVPSESSSDLLVGAGRFEANGTLIGRVMRSHEARRGRLEALPPVFTCNPDTQVEVRRYVPVRTGRVQ